MTLGYPEANGWLVVCISTFSVGESASDKWAIESGDTGADFDTVDGEESGTDGSDGCVGVTGGDG